MTQIEWWGKPEREREGKGGRGSSTEHPLLLHGKNDYHYGSKPQARLVLKIKFAKENNTMQFNKITY